MIKVSVCTIAYNHEHYLPQAIEGVLAQKRNFAIEMIIGEDCSTDNTREILRDYERRYPDIIKPIYHEKNVGSANNSYACLAACTGEYIAALEGDDFWTDDHKLQKQVDFLDSHPDYAICAHNLLIVDGNGVSTNELVNSEPPFDTFTAEELALANVLPTASCLYRNNFTAGPHPTGFPAWFVKSPIGDYCLHMLAARFGKIKYLPEVMGAYRVHGGGAWSLKNVVSRNAMLFDTLHILKQEFSGVIRSRLSQQQSFNLSEIADHSQATPNFNLTDFLAARKEAVLELVADDFMPFMQTHFSQQRAVRSAEYKYGQRMLKPARWLVDKMRKK